MRVPCPALIKIRTVLMRWALYPCSKNDQGTRHKFAEAQGSSPSPLFRWKSLELRAPLRSREGETGGSFLWRRWGDTHSFAALCPQGVPPPSSCHSGYSRHSPQELILRQNWRSCASWCRFAVSFAVGLFQIMALGCWGICPQQLQTTTCLRLYGSFSRTRMGPAASVPPSGSCTCVPTNIARWTPFMTWLCSST